MAPKTDANNKTGFRFDSRTEGYIRIVQSLLDADPSLKKYSDSAKPNHSTREKNSLTKSVKVARKAASDKLKAKDTWAEGIIELYVFSGYSQFSGNDLHRINGVLPTRDDTLCQNIDNAYTAISKDSSVEKALKFLSLYARDGSLHALKRLHDSYKRLCETNVKYAPQFVKLATKLALCGSQDSAFTILLVLVPEITS